MSKKKARRKISSKKEYPKCIYCQTEPIKGKWSKEHVVNRSILPKHNNKLTLIRKVCKKCNEGFAEIDKAFVQDTITGFSRSLMDAINDEDRWDNTQEPFVIKKTTITIRGDIKVLTLAASEKHEKNILRGIAKIALNALIYDLKGEKFDSFTDSHGNHHYTCARNDDTFWGNEKELSDIKKFVKEGGDFPIGISHKRIPLKTYNKNMDSQGQKIPMQNVTDPIHIIGIYKVQSYYYAVISLFIGLDERSPLYLVPLIADINEVDISITPEVVRMYNFGYLVKNQPQQESIGSDIIDIVEGDSVYLIKPVDNPELIHYYTLNKSN